MYALEAPAPSSHALAYSIGCITLITGRFGLSEHIAHELEEKSRFARHESPAAPLVPPRRATKRVVDARSRRREIRTKARLGRSVKKDATIIEGSDRGVGCRTADLFTKLLRRCDGQDRCTRVAVAVGHVAGAWRSGRRGARLQWSRRVGCSGAAALGCSGGRGARLRVAAAPAPWSPRVRDRDSPWTACARRVRDGVARPAHSGAPRLVQYILLSTKGSNKWEVRRRGRARRVGAAPPVAGRARAQGATSGGFCGGGRWVHVGGADRPRARARWSHVGAGIAGRRGRWVHVGGAELSGRASGEMGAK